MPKKGQTLSPEHKAKMIAGREAARKRASLAEIAAQGADATGIPAGHARNEQIRKNTDSLQAQAEIREQQLDVHPIDAAKLNAPVDNEAMRYYADQRKKRFEKQGGVENAQPGWHYARLKLPGTAATEDAKSGLRKAMTDAKMQGYVPVQGNDVEDKRYEGNDCAAGTSLRGYMDTVLMKIRIEDKMLMDEARDLKMRRIGAVEERTMLLAERKGAPYGAMAGDFNRNPEFAKRFSPDQRGAVTMFKTPEGSTVVQATFNEGDIRRGSIPGMPIGRQ